jgi:hypothetical protein
LRKENSIERTTPKTAIKIHKQAFNSEKIDDNLDNMY